MPSEVETVPHAVDEHIQDQQEREGDRRWSSSTRSIAMVALLAILVLAPLLLIIVLAVRLGSRGPILFRQRRVGLERPAV